MSSAENNAGWRAWAAYYIGVIMGRNDQRVSPELWEAVNNGLFDRNDDAEFQSVLGAAILGIVEVPIIAQKEVPDGTPRTEGPEVRKDPHNSN